MMVRLDFAGGARASMRAIRVSRTPGTGVSIIAEAGPRLPFRDGSVDELFVGRAISSRDDTALTLDELWRICKPGALIHLTLPHASSILAITRDPHARVTFTLGTFDYYDPNFKPADAASPAAFTIERARLHLAGRRGDDAGLALARGPLASFIEKLANGSRGSQYRFERWFSGLFGGFEEFSVVLSVVKPDTRGSSSQLAAADGAMRVTSDIEHESAAIEPGEPVAGDART